MAEAVSEASQIFERAIDLMRTSRGGGGEIKIAMTEGLATYWLARFLPWFKERYEGTTVNISCFDQIRDDKSERYDSQLQMFEPTSQSVISRRVATLHYIPYASENYVRQYGRPKTPEDLLDHRLLDLSSYIVTLGDWAQWVGDERIRDNRVLITDSSSFFFSALRGGMGIGLMPTYMSCLFPDVVPCDVGIKLEGVKVWHVYRGRAKAGRSRMAVELIDHAFNKKRMPWFEDKYVPPDEFFQIARALGIPL
jgi:DNA-binding transcriptional LysR family regulator